MAFQWIASNSFSKSFIDFFSFFYKLQYSCKDNFPMNNLGGIFTLATFHFYIYIYIYIYNVCLCVIKQDIQWVCLFMNNMTFCFSNHFQGDVI